jgi:hypothetical protein
MVGGLTRPLLYAALSALITGFSAGLAGVEPFTLAGAAGVSVYLLARSQPTYTRRRRAYEISALAPFILYEARIVMLSTRSLFEVIRHIADAGFRHVSRDFGRLRMRVLRGENPRKLLSEYASITDSQTLREGLLQLLTEHWAGNMGLYPLDAEAQARFVEETEKLYPKLAVASAWFFFAPILLAVLVAGMGHPNPTTLLGVFGAYLVFSLILRAYLARREASLVH